jgi:hypothetical protein
LPSTAQTTTVQCRLLPDKANRHGLITGRHRHRQNHHPATMAEGFSRQGVPVFMADIKGDLTGISQTWNFAPKAGQNHYRTRAA